ncbi:MAG: hypothetical protein ACRDN0_10265, partial [Trebonia sp.]
SGTAITAQSLFLLAMSRGPLSAEGSHRHQPLRVLRTSPTPAYGKTGVLRTAWWQTATANALVLGRRAHGYLIWEHRPDPSAAGPYSLRPVLGRLQPGLDKAFAAAKSARLLAVAGSNTGSNTGSTGSTGSTGNTSGTNGVTGSTHGSRNTDPPGGIPNILAMLRSGTTREALTFVVLREPPVGLPPDAKTVPLQIDPDRLTPVESPSDYLDVLVGVAGSDQFLPIRRHPVSDVFRAAKDHWLQVMETQLPVPPPTMTAPPDMLWARIRIGFRDPEYRYVADFLRELTAIAFPVWVRAWPEHIPRSLRTVPEDGISRARGTRREMMTAQDFDVVSVARVHGAGARTRTWRMLAVCVNTSFGVEHDVLDELAAQAPGLQLAAMSHAELHGMDMFLILGHVPGDAANNAAAPGGDTSLERALAARAKAPALRVVLDEWRTAEELGFADPGPLLRVDVRTRDRPGTLQVVLDALHHSLRSQIPSLPETDTSDWRVVLQTGAGRAALARLTLGLPVPADEVRDWPPSRWDEVARDAR